MKVIHHVAYWLLVLVFLTLFFGQNWESHLLALYFSSLLLPIVIGTSYFFNDYLIPKYLITGRYGSFLLFSFYMLVISLYLEMMVALFSFVILANYKIEAMSPTSSSILILGITLYLIVFITSFIRLFIQFRHKSRIVENLEQEKNKNEQTSLTLRVDRQNKQVQLDDILYVESLDDYIKVKTSTEELLTRESITRLSETLPDSFVRIHRSYIVNKPKVTSFSQSNLSIDGDELPISRTYKKNAIEQLSK